ncbi:hypothetical protein [Paenibacillus planticolens]|uniref:Uncharacterized protein n=1 Tax=Paenibacillus planticolens TaxID=2654976 RepID=A0ABX1ZLS6_9BACL|nr:hypothetical protein [Paenibacillus planticolens]NOV01017.1 hypothetical protein [Paenibacillus planticolens]
MRLSSFIGNNDNEVRRGEAYQASNLSGVGAADTVAIGSAVSLGRPAEAYNLTNEQVPSGVCLFVFMAEVSSAAGMNLAGIFLGKYS